MKKVTVLVPFLDLVEGIDREIGDTFTVSGERAQYLKKLLLVSVEDTEVEEKPKRKAAKKNRG